MTIQLNNRLINGGFESDFKGWMVENCRINSISKVGLKSAQLLGGLPNASLQQAVRVFPGVGLYFCVSLANP